MRPWKWKSNGKSATRTGHGQLGFRRTPFAMHKSSGQGTLSGILTVGKLDGRKGKGFRSRHYHVSIAVLQHGHTSGGAPRVQRGP